MTAPELPPLVIGFMNVKRGDIVRRMIGGEIPMDMIVLKVDERLIYAAPSSAVKPEEGWTFDRATGLEEDDDLGWGIMKGKTGSALDPQFGWRRRHDSQQQNPSGGGPTPAA